MACSRPNRILHDANWKGIEFLGPAEFQQELIDDRRFYGNSYDTELFHVPCGICLSCRISRRYERATRIMLEASCYPDNVFVTLTYDDENLGSNDLSEDHVTQFKKDIRRIYGEAKYTRLYRNPKRKTSSYTFKKFKFITTGEYGDKMGRKHYHLIIFGLGFKDMYHTGFYSAKGNPIYSSKELERVWSKGNVQVEKINFNLALYVGKYITDGWDDDESVNPISGEIRKPQYSTSSHGIGLSWLKRYWRDLLNAGKVVLSDRSTPIPRYFHKKMRELYPLEYSRWKAKRIREFSRRIRQLKLDKGDGMLASSIRAGQLTAIIHKEQRNETK